MIVTANQVTTAQLDAAMNQAVQRTQASCWEWSYIMRQMLNAPEDLTVVPGCDMFGFPDGAKYTTSDVFLSQLRAYQLTSNASMPGAGGSASGTPANSGTGQPKVTGTVAPGVLGLTNCSVCQQLAKQPLLLIGIAIAAYFLLFD